MANSSELLTRALLAKPEVFQIVLAQKPTVDDECLTSTAFAKSSTVTMDSTIDSDMECDAQLDLTPT